MGANDMFRHENLTEDQILQLEDAMRSHVVDGIPLNPRDIFRNPEKFNSYPLQVRQQVFNKIIPSTGTNAQYVDMGTGQTVGQVRPTSFVSPAQTEEPLQQNQDGLDSFERDIMNLRRSATKPPTSSEPNGQQNVQIEIKEPADLIESEILKVRQTKDTDRNVKTVKTAMQAAQEKVARRAAYADVIAGAPAAIVQTAGYWVNRLRGMEPEKATTEAQKISKPLEMLTAGKATGTSETKAYKSAIPTQALTYIGENIEKGAEALSRETGIPAKDIQEAINAGLIAAPVAGKAVKGKAAPAPAAPRVEPTFGPAQPPIGPKPKITYAEFQQQFAQKKSAGAGAELREAFEAKKMPSMEETGANPFGGQFTGEEKVRGQFPQIKESNISKDVPKSEQQTRASIANEILGTDQIRPGVVTGNVQTLRNEYALAKKAGDTPEGQLLRDQFAREQNALSKYALQRVENSGADLTKISPAERGHVINDFFAGRTEQGQTPNSLTGFFAAEKGRLYNEAKAKIGNNPITTGHVDAMLNDPQFRAGLKLTGNEKVAAGAQELIKLARTTGFKDEFGQFHAPNTIGAWDAVRKSLNANWTKDNAKVIRRINQAIDNDIASAGGKDLIKRADQLHQMEKDILGSKGIKTIFGEIDSNGVETGIAFDKLPQNLNNLPFNQWRHIYDTADKLSKGKLSGPIDAKTGQPKWEITVPPEVQAAAEQAKNEMRGNIAREVHEAGAGKAGVWNQNSTNKVLNARADKIRHAFSVEEQKAFNKLNYGGYLMPGEHSYEGAALQERRLGFIERNVPKVTTTLGTIIGSGVGGVTGAAVGADIGARMGAKMQAKREAKAASQKAKKTQQQMKKYGEMGKTVPLSDVLKPKD